MYRRPGIDEILREQGFSKHARNITCAMVSYRNMDRLHPKRNVIEAELAGEETQCCSGFTK